MKILVSMPNTGMVYADFMLNVLKIKRPSEHHITWAMSSHALIYDSRNKAAAIAIKENFDYVLFIDSDMLPPEDVFNRMIAHDKDIVSGLYFKRCDPYLPVVYKTLKVNGNTVDYEVMQEWEDGLVKVDGVGMGCCLIKTDVFKAIGHSFFTPTLILSEDLAFCLRAREKGFDIYLDTTMIVPHIATHFVTEQNYINAITKK